MAPDPPGFFPPARTIPPLSLPHLNTLILLHGRGLSAHTFGPDFISAPFPFPTPSPNPTHHDNTASQTPSPSETQSLTTLRALHPHTKILLPLAPRHRATIYARSIIHQWFDSWHLSPLLPTNTEEWRATPGLHDTVAHLHCLIREEAALVGGPQNIVLGGLSQGCAASLVALLLWEGEALGGFLGMCGWLVFEGDVRGVVLDGGDGKDGEGGDDDDDPFERGEEEEDVFERGDDEGEEAVVVEVQVVSVLRERLEMDGERPKVRPRAFDTPVFLGHGDLDDKVPVSRGKGAADCLKAAGLDAEWRVYHGLGHWYSADMLTDMASFLTHRASWDKVKKPP
jgi:predicted esterase